MSGVTARKRLHVGVRELVSHLLRAGDLNLETFGGSFSSPVDAIRAHQKLQAARGEDYTKEVALSYTVEDGDITLEIGGRIDGVFADAEPVIVEEIKTTRDDLDERVRKQSPTHWGQLKVYAFIYAQQQELDELTGRLTYYQIDSGETREIDEPYRLVELRSWFEDLVERYLGWLRRIESWRSLRDQSIESTDFPFSDYRPGQRRMAVGVYRTIENEAQLLVRAPTGIGKTIAALFPAVKALGKALVDKAFYLTARTTGRAVAESALAELRNRGLRVKSLTVTAKDKTCFNPEKACNGSECEFARGFYDRIDQAMEALFETDDLTRDRIEAIARTHQVCPFELSLELALWVDIIVCDYNYVFDPRTSLKRFFDNGKTGFVFLVDEAHNLLDRARDIYSAEITKREFLSLKRVLDEKRHRALRLSADAVNRAFLKARGREKDAYARPEPPEWLYPSLRRFVRAAEVYLVSGGFPHPSHTAIVELYFAASAFLRVAERFDARYVTCYEESKRDTRIRLYCTDPAPELEQSFQKSHASVLFSATLSPLRFFHETLGCGDAARHLVLPSPFPSEKLLVLVGDRIATTYRARDRSRAELSGWLERFVSVRRGNYLLYFPSYAYMEAVRQEMGERPDIDFIAQRSDMSESERSAFLDRFRTRGPRTLVGFAVLGGFFGEGIDLVGDRLEGVAIVGVGLPGLSPERDHIRGYFDASGEDGFAYAYAFPGMNRVLQAAGRLIRTENDRGAVLLLDERFSQPLYRRQLPTEWSPSFPRDDDEMERMLTEFWSNDRDQPAAEK